jgi:hypothetical protein
MWAQAQRLDFNDPCSVRWLYPHALQSLVGRGVAMSYRANKNKEAPTVMVVVGVVDVVVVVVVGVVVVAVVGFIFTGSVVVVSW